MDFVEIWPPEGPDELGFYTVLVTRRGVDREAKSREPCSMLSRS